ncbi:MAG TPA: GAF domain-containing protein, partial [Bryobacteraceae bacterium]
MLQRLAETVLSACRADTAGISLLEIHDGVEVFRWEALAGVCVAARNTKLPRAASPCGICIAQDKTTLMCLPERWFPAVPRDPQFVEVLLVPFHYQGKPIGTVWAIMHQFERKFDLEDARLLEGLAALASAGWQLWRAQSALEDRVA